MKETTLHSEVIYDGKIIRVEKDQIEVGGRTSTREVVFNSGGVSVLALSKDHKIVMVKQFRYPSKEELYEIPGGKQEVGETFVETGLRELKEETGYVSEDAVYFGYFYPTVAYSTEIIHLVLAKNCTYEKQCLDPGEHVEVELIPLETAKEMILDHRIKDGKTILSILKYEVFGSK